jgi:hypothetical protein
VARILAVTRLSRVLHVERALPAPLSA